MTTRTRAVASLITQGAVFVGGLYLLTGITNHDAATIGRLALIVLIVAAGTQLAHHWFPPR